jgi:DNA-directed RNA polymerase subunit RPC12/RpoP
VRRFVAIGTNQGFTCAHCGAAVPPLANGSYRNHCPACLHSVHVDVNPGDRASDCGGLLVPVGAELTGHKGWVVVHRCDRCGAVRRNKAALDDPLQPDDLEALAALSARAPRGPHRW